MARRAALALGEGALGPAALLSSRKAASGGRHSLSERARSMLTSKVPGNEKEFSHAAFCSDQMMCV